jgi:hypothetical protein
MSVRHSSAADTASVIRQMAKQYDVVLHPTNADVLAHHMTRLAGDSVELDEVEQMLIALQRAGHLSRVDAVRLQARYLRELKS